MKPNPYLIKGPALISFSGGRTSAYMLRRILDAYNGALPADVHVCFANTGKERTETLRFVQDCDDYWGVRVRWVEWRDTEAGFEEVGSNSASRNGEPFEAVIRKRNYLPNAVTRFCTVMLKVRTMAAFMRAQGYDHWDNAIGLRYDEGMRVMKALARNDENKERFKAIMPLSSAHVTKRDVMAFWAQQGFDLQLEPHEGNCDLCFLKAKRKLLNIIRDDTRRADWWIAQECAVRPDKASGARFVTEYGYADLVREARDQGHLFDGWLEDDEHDVECGLLCEPEPLSPSSTKGEP